MGLRYGTIRKFEESSGPWLHKMANATFSEILTAVKPRERTDRYKVLAALYCLSARRAPVTTRQVSDLLRLHLRNMVPQNLSDCLRRYSADVEVAEKGPPLRWTLTAKGLENLRGLSGLELRSTPSAQDYGADVGIICALDTPEFAAVVDASGGNGQWKEIPNPSIPHRYRETTIMTTLGHSLRVVGTTAMSMGLTSAAIVTTQLVLLHRPRLVMMVGIAAGTKDGGKQFGDVLAADPSVDYNSGKVVEDKGIREFLPDPYPIGLNPRIRSLLQKYLGAPPIFDEIPGKWAGKRPGQPNRLHLGPLGAADQVIDDASRVVEIQKNWRKLIGVEMETYAVYRACHDAPDPKPKFLSLKSVCDFAAAKGDSWQSYAAFMAAEFGIRFIKAEWEAMWPDLAKEGED